MADFKIGDKVKIINFLDEYNGKKGRIDRDAGKRPLPGSRKLYEGFKGKGEQQHWVVILDDANETIEVPEVNLEKIS